MSCKIRHIIAGQGHTLQEASSCLLLLMQLCSLLTAILQSSPRQSSPPMWNPRNSVKLLVYIMPSKTKHKVKATHLEKSISL